MDRGKLGLVLTGARRHPAWARAGWVLAVLVVLAGAVFAVVLFWAVGIGPA